MDDDTSVRFIAIIMAVFGLFLIALLIGTGFCIYVRILRPRMAMRRRMKFNGSSHPDEMLGHDPLLVDPVTLASPWTYRQPLPDGEAFIVV